MDPSFDALIQGIRRGDAEAARRLVRDFEPEIRRAVRIHLHDSPLQRQFDSMDICQSVLASRPERFRQLLSRGQGRPLPQLQDRESLWRLLFAMTVRKAQHLLRDESCQKRGGGTVLGESSLPGPADPENLDARLIFLLRIVPGIILVPAAYLFFSVLVQ